MWQEYYDKMSDDDKNMLPLKRISFLGNNEKQEKTKKNIPLFGVSLEKQYYWANGHSDVLLPDEVVDMLDELYHGKNGG